MNTPFEIITDVFKKAAMNINKISEEYIKSKKK
jgi:hypothetical protein